MTDKEAYSKYIHSIKDIPRITKEEEKELSSIIRDNPSSSEASRAKETIVEANLKFVVGQAQKYYQRFVSGKGNSRPTLMELISSGNAVLVKASNTFDGTKASFCTYVRSGLINAFRETHVQNSRVVEIPEYQTRMWSKLNNIQEDEKTDHLSDANIARALDISIFDKKKIQMIRQAWKTKTICTEELIETIPDEKPDLLDVIMHKDLMALVIELAKNLKPIQKKVFLMKVTNPGISLAEIGSEMSLTRERIRQIYQKACTNLRKEIAKTPQL